MEQPQAQENKLSPTERLNQLLEDYKRIMSEQVAARELLDDEIRKSQALIKDVEKVAKKYRQEVIAEAADVSRETE